MVQIMRDHRVETSEYGSEEKTEPFSQTEYTARLQRMRVQESFSENDGLPVHLDELVVPPDKDIRILVRPLKSQSVSPGNHDNCEWLALRAEVAAPDQPQQKVLAVTQTSQDIKFIVRVPGERLYDGSPKEPLWCELYYDPASDNQILLNKSDIPISLSRLSHLPPSSPAVEYDVYPGTHKALIPGTWRIRVDETEVLDFRILEKRQAALMLPTSSSSGGGSILSDMVNSSGKRSFVADEGDALGPQLRKIRSVESTGKHDDGVIMFLRPGGPTADPLVFPLPTAAKPGKQVALASGHALLDMQKDDTVAIPGGCEIDEYQLTKREAIANTSLSSVFTGESSRTNVPDEGIITVKVLKTRSTAAPDALARPHEVERNVIRQADIWLREYQSHRGLQHENIVRLYGGDARYLSLYMEHVDARDLSSKGHWRARNSDFFTGTRQDAMRILRDIAGALQYLHGRNYAHNDIKPANILYSPERGAVLCDFGLSTHNSNPASMGGTPYYVPPEFIGAKQRGTPSDVWALGITMLYVLRKIPFPDSRGRQGNPKQLYWMIADVNANRRGNMAGPSAVSQMRTWLSEVHEAKEKLDPMDRLEKLVGTMLAPIPSQRTTMKTVMSVMNDLCADMLG